MLADNGKQFTDRFGKGGEVMFDHTGDQLNNYALPLGGGYLLARPGVASPDDWYARSLLSP